MCSSVVEQSQMVALYFGLVLFHLTGEGGMERVLCRPGQGVSLPCSYHYEDQAPVSELSVQWKSPSSRLLCHYIKHKAFQNCSTGYSISYRPGNIQLFILQVQTEDFGTHVCSVSKRHEFSDFSMELDWISEFITSAPTSDGNQPGLARRLSTLYAFICLCFCRR
ncbi:hypothetical protein FQA47_017575 [Oryzias melastigma]|uniref:Ig-like domain-containing protein n=1 Tax=Oryzias melastigma TaxID=30732 RepID=A0A834CKW7_ORYME|nr:hypothetical protein FQA47_017575 [Oryzias melastigma]